jgi:hypothetical protein
MLDGVVQLTKEREHEALEAEAAASAAKELERGLTREAQDAEDAAQRAEDAAARGEAMDDTLDASLKVSTQERENDIRERLERIKSEVQSAEEEASRLERLHRRSKEPTKKEPPHKETREDRRRNHARRMGDVEAQLSRKRAQVATMTKEKVDLERKLAGVLAKRGGTKGAVNGARGGVVGSVGARTVGGLKRRGGSYPAGGGGNDFPDTPGRVGFRSRVGKVTRRVDELSVFAGRHLRRSGGWRSAVIVYVLSLHSLAFIVLAIRAMSAPGPTK